MDDGSGQLVVDAACQDGVATVAVRCEPDLMSGPELEGTLQEVLGKHPDFLVLELSDLSFVDCAGLKAMTHTLDGSTAQVVLRHPSALAGKVFELTGLAQRFVIDQ